MRIALLYRVSHCVRVKKQGNMGSWDPQGYLVVGGFCYVRPLCVEVPLHIMLVIAIVFYFQLLMKFCPSAVCRRTRVVNAMILNIND